MKTNRILLYSVISGVFLSVQAFAADSGDCGQNCRYVYNDGILTFSPIDSSLPATISKSTSNYNLSGIVKDAIVSEGIENIYYDGINGVNGMSSMREIGTSDGKLVLPHTLKNMGLEAMFRLGFGTIEINSEHLSVDDYSFRFLGQDVTIIMSASSDLTFSNDSFYPLGEKSLYPSSLHILCKGNPEVCLGKFGHALDQIDPKKITIASYKDENQKFVRRIYTVSEAEEALGKKNKNTFFIKYR